MYKRFFSLNFLILLVISLLFSGCYLPREPQAPITIQETPPPEPTPEPKPKIAKVKPQAAKKEEKIMKEEEDTNEPRTKPIKIIWARPEEVPAFYHLHYGFEPDEINSVLRLPVEELEALNDRVYGPIFRYTLEGLPDGKDVYIFMRSENSAGISEGSQVLRVNKVTGIGEPLSGRSEFKPSQRYDELRNQVRESLEKLKTP